MRNNRKKLNQGIMYGVMAMAVVVILIVLLFWYLMMDSATSLPVPQE